MFTYKANTKSILLERNDLMALFKSLRGKRENLPSTKTDGYAYFCTNDGTFWIDYKDENGVVQRKQLNAKDAETLMGASLSTILNDSEVEIPTSKAVSEAIDSINQGLTDYVKTSDLDSVAFDGYVTKGAKSGSVVGEKATAEGGENTASGKRSHAEGYTTTASGENSHAEGSSSVASAQSAHAEGTNTTSGGIGSHAEGYFTSSSNMGSHSEGANTDAHGKYSHAEGSGTKSSGSASHAEGGSSSAIGDYSHSEGSHSSLAPDSITASSTSADVVAAWKDNAFGAAIGLGSHSEGQNTIAFGRVSHSEGSFTQALGLGSHAEGSNNIASADASHAEGFYTIAGSRYQHVEGKYNIEDTAEKYAHIVGNGRGQSSSMRSNAHTLDWSGNAWYSGKVSIGTTSSVPTPTNANDLVTKKYVDNKFRTKTASVALASTDWTGTESPYSQEVIVDGATSNSKVDLQPTGEQLNSLATNRTILNTANDNGTVTVYAIGNKPTEDYTMQATITEV
jgi:hypothetical protein